MYNTVRVEVQEVTILGFLIRSAKVLEWSICATEESAFAGRSARLNQKSPDLIRATSLSSLHFCSFRVEAFSLNSS